MISHTFHLLLLHYFQTETDIHPGQTTSSCATFEFDDVRDYIAQNEETNNSDGIVSADQVYCMRLK